MLSSSNALKLGYYQVGNQVHLNKISALIDGTKRNIHPQWIFNNEIFDKFDWSIEPEESLQELYAQRAREIRNTYDYIVLAYSGGSDSENVFNTFVKNNLRIDEIYTSFPMEMAEKKGADQWDYSSANQLSEWELTVKPKLKWIRQNYPEIKITCYDWAQGYEQYKIDDDFVLVRDNNIAYFTDQRWSLEKVPSIDKKLNQIKNSILLTGTCKPRLCLQDNTYKLYFIDQIKHGPTYELNLDRTVWFYWHPHSAKIISKQSHEIIKFFEKNPVFKQYIQWPQTPRARDFYESAIRAIIYPDQNLNYFQGSKWPNFNFAWDTVLMTVDPTMDDKLRFHLRESMQGLHKIIDDKYFQKNRNGEQITGFITGMYPVAKESVVLR